MKQFQTGILAPIPNHAEYLYFTIKSDTTLTQLGESMTQLAELIDGDRVVLGLSAKLCARFGKNIPGLREFRIAVPTETRGESKAQSTNNPNADLWCWTRSADRSQLFTLQHQLRAILEPCFELSLQLPAFCFQGGRDLTGYEDGTENPSGDDAFQTAFVTSANSSINASSFVVTQQWRHRFEQFHRMSSVQQDHTIGRRRSDNEELDDAPESAHVKRTAQEDFEPEAFVLRRSMPWSHNGEAGLLFTAFAQGFDAFEAQFKRMLGYDDGIVDALFSISEPLTTHYFWCPPLVANKLDLSAILGGA